LLQSAGHGDGQPVISGTFWGVVPLLLGLFGAQAGTVGQAVTRLIIQDEVILRVPVQPRPLMPEIEWVEKKGPKCIPAKSIRGAMLSGREHVDFVLYDRTRLRARLSEDCPALDFYNGFYLTPDDGQVCIKRDTIHSRMGSSCRIERFRRLEPKIAR